MPLKKYTEKGKAKNASEAVAGKGEVRKQATKSKRKRPGREIADLVKGCRKTKMPDSVEPMLCTLTKEVLEDQRFLYEIKWDGYRIIAYVQNRRVRMDSLRKKGDLFKGMLDNKTVISNSKILRDLA